MSHYQKELNKYFKLFTGRSYWLCSKKFSTKCHARVITELTKVAPNDSAFYLSVVSHNGKHTHEPDPRVTSSKSE